MKLKCAYGIAPGSLSADQEIECQNKIKIADENGVSVVSLADPAGVAENLGSSAELAAEAVAAIMAEYFEELYVSKDDFIKKSITEKIKQAFQREGNKFSNLDGSLLCIAVKENRYLAGHVGGGLIARLNGSCWVLSEPETENHDMTNLRIYKGDLQEPFGFMLMSNGACQSLYDGSTYKLSSACDTFFEWLKEYDEETVSEALTENINKYFLKDTKGDISVVVMVSDEDDTEPYAVLPETRDPVKKIGNSTQLLKYLIAVIFVVAAIFVCTLIKPEVTEQKDQGKAETKPPVIYSASYEPSVTFSVENPESFEAGEYEIGVDIPAGEYFFWTGDMLKPDSVEVNGDTCLSAELYCMTIKVDEGDTLISEYRFTAAENVNPVKATKGVLISGKYKIGKDIAPGEYKVSPKNKNMEGRYYSIFDEEISNDKEFSDETTVEVPEEGYVVIYNSVLAVDQK